MGFTKIIILMAFMAVLSLIIAWKMLSVIDKSIGKSIGKLQNRPFKPNIVINIQRDMLKEQFNESVEHAESTKPPTSPQKNITNVPLVAPAQNQQNVLKASDPKPIPPPVKPVIPQNVKCHNDSINARFSTGPQNKRAYKVMCGTETQEELPPEQYYKTKYRYPEAEIDPKNIKGFNYMSYNDNPNPYSLGDLLYNKEDSKNVPVGMNYQF